MKNLFPKSIIKNIFVAIFFALFVLLSVMIIYFSTENGEQSSQTSGTVGEIVATAADSIGIHVDKNSDSYKNFIRKMFGHFGLFFATSLDAVLVTLLLKNNPHVKRIVSYVFLAYGLILATITEIIQTQAGERSGQFVDVLIDYAGFIIPLGIYLLSSFIIYRKNRKKCRMIEV